MLGYSIYNGGFCLGGGNYLADRVDFSMQLVGGSNHLLNGMVFSM